MSRYRHVPLSGVPDYSPEETLKRARTFRDLMVTRRSVRHFSDRPVSREVIAFCLEAAAAAPSGANQQPWHFVAISDPELKRRIREGAEEEERAFYAGRAPEEWLEALAPLGTDENKPFLETASWLIAIFACRYDLDEAGQQIKHYYVSESVGIATGVLITAVHQAGLVCLTHTPSPMGFLNEILDRPENEKPYLLLVVGHPAVDARVPEIARRAPAEVTEFRE